MAQEAAAARRTPRGAVISVIVAVLAMIVVGAVAWPGYDAKETPKDEVSVWALQSVGGKRYARINTELGELDTVRGVENATRFLQSGSSAMLLADGNSRFANLDPSDPPELIGEVSEYFQSTPPDTDQVVSAGDTVAFLTGTGRIYAAPVADPSATVQVDPYADVEVGEGEEPPVFVAAAVAVSLDGQVAAYSADEKRVIFANGTDGEVVGEEPWDVSSEGTLQMAYTGDEVALFDADSGSLWMQGQRTPIATGAEPGAVLQESGPNDSPLIADSAGLLEIADGNASRIVELGEAAEPAQPAPLGQTMFAAWLGPVAGTLWSSDGEQVELPYGGVDTPETMVPRLVSNGSRMIVNDVASGWSWLVPSGELIVSSQQWDVDEDVVKQVDDTVAEKVVDPKPPVAEPDQFGVRPGRETLLPVLLNDHDPNEDVLSIAPDSLTDLPEDFGSVVVAADNQQLVVRVNPEASGTATFSYKATDGTAADGLLSDSATVTLNVVPDDVNSAPVWCGVEGCLQTWPMPTVAPGGTVTTQVLPGWVDPEGDPLYLVDASTPEVGSIVTNPDGTVTYSHPDANATDPLTIPVELSIGDTAGAVAHKTLNIQVTPSPRLEVLPVLVSGVTGQPVEVELSEHVTGTAGRAKLTAATPVAKDGVEVKMSSSELSFTLTATKPGSYPVQVTVKDDASEATGNVRVIVTDPDAATISAVPITVFIRPNEDTTVDIMPTVTNPANLVLMVDGLSYVPAENAELSADIVGQRNLHAAGRTLDGRPGTLGTGTFEVSDGSGDPKRTATGQVTFVLLPEAPASAPITTDDWVTVPVGAQVDIPVLDSDIAPVGSQLTLDPASIVNEQQAGLAFASKRVLRYLAPDQPGEYSVTYSAARLGYPELTSTSRVHITVQQSEADVTPRPRTLSGRVLQGHAVSIPFDSFKADQNGAIVELTQVSAQPQKGSAAISPEGDAIIYTALPGTRGQDAFQYQVRDQAGKVGTGTVKVGILDAEADPRPITYSDYLQIQAGSDSEAVVFPAATDIDPEGGELSVIDVIPNAPVGTDQYRELEQRLVGFDEETGEVRIRAGADLGTTSYIYTVRNSKGDTAMGLIIVKVVRGKVPDAPVVRDTTLTAETLEQLPSGVDVVKDKVSWNTGDVGDLKMSLWNDPPNFSAVGWSISGRVPSEWTIVPFKVEGTDFMGEAGSSYGFLRVPGQRDVHLALRAAYTQVEVGENRSVEVDLNQAVATPAGEALEVDVANVHASGVRGAASCSVGAGNVLRYTAGKGAPWTDTCTIPVKVASMEYFTYLSMAVKVIPVEAQPTLRNASFEVSPGQTAVYDLQQMVQWDGTARWDSLQFQATAQGSHFEVRQVGAGLEIKGLDSARQGNREPVSVTLSSHPDVPAATLTLTVGPAPGQNPIGGTVTAQCTQNQPGSCVIPTAGAAGQYNALPSTPLQLKGVTNPASCPGVSFAVQGDSIVASWSAETPGKADCTGSFTVADAQNREGTGTVTLDLRGFPAAPATIEWIGYTEDSVSLKVVSSGGSYPAVEGFTVSGGGKNATCGTDGVCRIGGMTLGEAVTFEARSVNAVGESRGAVTTSAYSYRAPHKPTAKAAPEPNGNVGGRAKITVETADETTGSFLIDGNSVPASSGTATQVVEVPNGTPRDVVVVPVSRFSPPNLASGSGNAEGAQANVQAFGIGAPTIQIDTPVVSDSGLATATVRVTDTNGLPSSGVTKLGITAGDSCTAESTATAEKQLKPGETVTFTACATNVFDEKNFGNAEPKTVTANYPVKAPTGGSYGFKKALTTSTPTVYTWNEFALVPPTATQADVNIRYGASAAAEGLQENALSLFSQIGSGPNPLFAFAVSANGVSEGVALSVGTDLMPTGRQVTFSVASGAQCPADFALAAPFVSVAGAGYGDLEMQVGPAGGATAVTFKWDTSGSQWTCQVPAEEPESPDPEGPGDGE